MSYDEARPRAGLRHFRAGCPRLAASSRPLFAIGADGEHFMASTRWFRRGPALARARPFWNNRWRAARQRPASAG